MKSMCVLRDIYLLVALTEAWGKDSSERGKKCFPAIRQTREPQHKVLRRLNTTLPRQRGARAEENVWG